MNPSTQAEPELRSGSKILIEALKLNGAEQIFGYPGGTIMPVYDALVGSGLKHYLCRHEQGAALAGSGNSINNPQMPMIAPASIHELHLARIPNNNSSRSRSTRTYVNNPYGRSIQIDPESRVHKTDIDAVSAALVSALSRSLMAGS